MAYKKALRSNRTESLSLPQGEILPEAPELAGDGLTEIHDPVDRSPL
jgi:hypothetical protein